MTPNDPRWGTPNQYGPPNQYPPPNPYGGYPPPYQDPYPMTMAPREDSEANMIFILGILGIVVCAICAPIAWAKGQSYRTTCRVMGVAPSGMATAGWIMGIIGTVIFVLSIVVVIAAAALS